MTEYCPCGQPLHYANPAVQRLVEKLINDQGPNIPVHCGTRVYMIPRHWIALHGIKAREVPILAHKYGWEEVKGERG